MNDHEKVLRELRGRCEIDLRMAQGLAEEAKPRARIAALDYALAAIGERGEPWRPIAEAPEEAASWLVWSAYYNRPVVVTNRQHDNTFWEGDWEFDVDATHWHPPLPTPPTQGAQPNEEKGK